MRPVPLPLRFCIVCIAFSALLLSTFATAQQNYVPPRVREPLDEGRRIVLKGNVHPLARAQYQVAGAPADLPMDRMLLVLKRSPEQEAALLKLLDSQQDKSSPDFHKWLTPEQFGQQFGPADSDIHAVTSWLEAHGFTGAQVSKGRTVIEFSGTAAQVKEAFHTGINKYVANGKSHWANANDPEIPAALAPVVAGVHSLHNFYAQPQLVTSGERVRAKITPGRPPEVTFSDGSHALTPADYAVIYNAKPALLNGINGTGQAVAVVARSNLFNAGQDVLDFRSAFEISGGSVNVILNGPDPGDLGGGEELEATLDATWSSALAPSADVDFVVSASTNSTDGIFLSEAFIIDNNLAPVMTLSFGGCEAAITNAQAQGISAVAEQAAAQGITFIASTGDSGAEGCDNQRTVAQGPISVSDLASNPFVVALGGTQFNENGHDSTFWNNTDTGDGGTAKSYIPENVWNESCSSAQCGGNANILAGGGGASVLFSKPSWQAGVSGIPNDGARDLPDISLTASGHDAYLICLEGSCVPDSQGFIQLAEVEGTSASAPSFAGIMALVNQKTNERQGQANYVLYRLAATETLSQCNGSKTTALPASTCIFNDVTVGNNAVPGEVGFGGASAKYQSTVGYDLATGLGSVNVNNLLNGWSSVVFTATTSTLVLSPTTFTHGSAANVTIHVAPSSGSGVPTGDVALLTGVNTSLQGVGALTLNAGAASSTTADLPGGTYPVHAHYAGDGTFAASDSAPITITVSPEGSTTALSALGFDALGNLIPFTSQPYGNPLYLRADVAGLSGHGLASGMVAFSDNGASIGSGSFSLNSEGTASTAQGVFTTSVGQHSIVAHYLGDSGLNPSTSAAVPITVTQAPTTTAVAPLSNPVIQGTPLTLTAIVSTASAGLRPGGTLTFLSGGTPIAGSPVSVIGTDGSASIQSGVFTTALGTASLQASLPTGQNIITVQYSGDANYAGSTSSAMTVNVQADFAFAASAPTITIARPGGSGTATLTVTGRPGYSGTINFSAASCSGLPRESTCSFNPASVTNSGTTTLTVSTTGAHSARLESPAWWATSFGVALAGVLLLGNGSRRRAWKRLLSLIAVSCLVAIVSCGGGDSHSSGGNTDPGTPAGSSTVTVTAINGSLTHTATFTLTVQ
jgi:Pro-kumamolisin, activation domain/Bacterial Ig-like domain (group 3)